MQVMTLIEPQDGGLRTAMTAYHFLARVKQGFAQVQNLEQALGVGVTQA